MAWIDPPIEQVINKAGSRYALVTVVSKRAKELVIERPEFFRDNPKVKPIEMASREFYKGLYTVKPVKND